MSLLNKIVQRFGLCCVYPLRYLVVRQLRPFWLREWRSMWHRCPMPWRSRKENSRSDA